jgi:hypothetical protein
VPVVADQKHRAFEFEEDFLEQFERFDIEVVGRLIKHQEISRPSEKSRENGAIHFTP